MAVVESGWEESGRRLVGLFDYPDRRFLLIIDYRLSMIRPSVSSQVLDLAFTLQKNYVNV
jgi:hypothetical protein